MSRISNLAGFTTSLSTTEDLTVGLVTATNKIEVRSDDASPGRVDYYCEVTNVHYTRVQSAPHAEYSGNVTAVLPTVSGDILVGDSDTPISQNINTTGIVTASSFVGNISGVAATFSGNVSIAGTLTYEDVTNVDSIGLVTARNGIQVLSGGIDVTGIGTISDLNLKGAVETVSVGSTYDLGGGRVVLECDATNGTVFTHNLTNGNVGIVSLRNFPVRGNSVTTYSIIFNQLSTEPTGGIGNTTPGTGIGTNITLTPSGVSGFTTSARVATASTVTLSTTANDVDIVTFAVHYNGSGTGSVGNYRVFVTNNSGFRFGSVGF